LGEDLAALCAKVGVEWSEAKKTAYAKTPNFRLNVLATDGPLDSVWRLLHDDEVQMAITHADVWSCAGAVAEAYRTQGNTARAQEWDRVSRDTRLLLPLHGAPIQILVNRRTAADQGLTDLASLADPKFLVADGPPSSANAITGYLLHRALSSPENPGWRATKRDARAGLDLLAAGKVHAVILVGSFPHPALAAYPDWEDRFSLLGFGRASDRISRKEYPERKLTAADSPAIPSGQDLVTRQVPVVLVTHRAYGGSDRRMLWVKHTVYRLLSHVERLQAGVPPRGVDWLRGADLWPQVAPTGMADLAWTRHPEMQDWADAWAKAYKPPVPGQAPPDQPEPTLPELPALPFLPMPGAPAKN
jgi:hypothetical protein